MSWEDQGRQEHGWFGHGTAPPKLKPDGSDRGGRFGPDGLDQRLRAMGHTAIAAVPRTLRHHQAASYKGPALDQLVTTMHGWVRGLLLDRAEFAKRYFGRGVSDPMVDHLWQAAKFAATARNEQELWAGTEHLAAAMQAEGLDRWRRFMANAQQRAVSAARLPVPALNGDPKPAAPKAISGSVPLPTDRAQREMLAKELTSGDRTTTPQDVKLVRDELVKTVPTKELQALKDAAVTSSGTNSTASPSDPQLVAALIHLIQSQKVRLRVACRCASAV